MTKKKKTNDAKGMPLFPLEASRTKNNEFEKTIDMAEDGPSGAGVLELFKSSLTDIRRKRLAKVKQTLTTLSRNATGSAEASLAAEIRSIEVIQEKICSAHERKRRRLQKKAQSLQKRLGVLVKEAIDLEHEFASARQDHRSVVSQLGRSFDTKKREFSSACKQSMNKIVATMKKEQMQAEKRRRKMNQAILAALQADY